MLQIVILLEVDSVRFNAKVMEGTYEGGLENINILHSIHDPLDAMEMADTIWCDASPDHNTPPSVFDCFVGVAVMEFLPWPSPAPLTPIRPK